MRFCRSSAVWILAALAALVFQHAAFAQAAVPPWSPSEIGNVGIPHRHINRAMARARNAERQKQLVADTQRLVQLANELQADAGKSNRDALSLEMVRKVEEIQKLAKTVRNKMKDAS